MQFVLIDPRKYISGAVVAHHRHIVRLFPVRVSVTVEGAAGTTGSTGTGIHTAGPGSEAAGQPILLAAIWLQRFSSPGRTDESVAYTMIRPASARMFWPVIASPSGETSSARSAS
jgi:hypothetical protein